MVTVLAQEFFLTEILGRRVFLKRRRVGTLGDLAIVETGRLPEVSHLLVSRSYGYPTLTVPWDKVLLISNTEIALDIDESAMAQYERVPSDGLILLKEYILDKKILDLDDHEVEVVYDVRLVFQNGRLHASEVDFSRYRALRRLGLKRLAKLLTARNDSSRVSWLYVQPLPSHLGSFSGSVKLKVPKAELAEIHPVDLADILEELDSGQRVALFNQLEPGHASDTLEEVEPRVQRELISAIKKERAAQLINDMTPAQAADVLGILSRSAADEILKLIDPETGAKVSQILSKHDEQVLLYGSSAVIRVPPAMTVREALAQYRELARDKDEAMYLYVVDEQGVLKGVVDVRQLISSQPEDTLASLMTEHVISLAADATLRDAVAQFQRYGFRALPITDPQDRLLAVVSQRDTRSVKSMLG
jgi:CBS domain-containing protein